ncbi:hypothetical protein AB205_0176210 [Aquarana catesbeiana]|uniref:Uncharacterized protein n=1 Tax=Aquarana catesbeiana TaxID=8400 RepID=A0A2G9R8E6_AQUCT|nr:hypothetical protein AB205_0176210 [Aquarana catesbeiana]
MELIIILHQRIGCQDSLMSIMVMDLVEEKTAPTCTGMADGTMTTAPVRTTTSVRWT